MGAIANTIAIVVIVCVGYLIIKKVYPTAVLMIAGLVLLCCAVLLDVEPGLALKKGTGSEFFDIFKIIQDVFSTTLGGLGLNIMCMGGFAKYMDKLEAGRSLYDVVSAPLKYPENRGIYTQSDSSKKSSRNIWSLAVVSVDQRY